MWNSGNLETWILGILYSANLYMENSWNSGGVSISKKTRKHQGTHIHAYENPIDETPTEVIRSQSPFCSAN